MLLLLLLLMSSLLLLPLVQKEERGERGERKGGRERCTKLPSQFQESGHTTLYYCCYTGMKDET